MLRLVDVAVAREDPGDGEADVLSDVDRVVGDAFHVAAHPGQLNGSVHVHALGLAGEQDIELANQRVDRVVLPVEAKTRLRIQGGHAVDSAAELIESLPAEPGKHALQLAAEPEALLTEDALSTVDHQVAAALDLVDDSDDRDKKPQAPGNRLLEGDMSTPEGRKMIGDAHRFKTHCPRFVKDAAEIAEKLMEK